MTILESMGLVVAIIVISTSVAYYIQMGQLPTKEWNKKIKKNLLKQQKIDETVEPVSTEEVAKPKKKRKYYPRKPKTSI